MNSNLTKAKKAKNDEFYTRLTDIEKELKHYRSHFEGKTILCNCDDPFESNFFKYFALNFNILNIKKLIVTGYSTSPIQGETLDLKELFGPDFPEGPYKAEMNELRDVTGDGGIDIVDIKQLFTLGKNHITPLQGDGDFRSEECIELLKEADIVVTNPPFSLFREYVAQLMEYEKKFLIIGNKNAVTYKEIFPLIKDNKMWIGFMTPSDFITPEGELSGKLAGLTRWFTNLDILKRHEEMILVEKYDPEKYPTYDNYDAINIDRVNRIPYDYEGAMGVPITFLDKYSPDQFEILDANDYRREHFTKIKAHGLVKDADSSVNGKAKYARVLIKNKHPRQTFI